MPRGEPGPQAQSGPDLPLELDVWPALSFSLGGACGWSGCGS
jgi:hypothetical protein